MSRIFFGINYEFDKAVVIKRIAEQVATDEAAYICVADGVVLNTAQREPEYREIVNGSVFSVCDSSYVPLYILWIYGLRYGQYAGSDLFMDIVREKRYKQFFLGTKENILSGLKQTLSVIDPGIGDMTFYAPPYCAVEDFDYHDIAMKIKSSEADIIWIALGAPKQEIFMNRLKPLLRCGVMISVGAVFKFYSGIEVRRAPKWIVSWHLEFVWRIVSEPRKQIKRCAMIIQALPGMLWRETQHKNKNH
ncbi:MAG: WecB/TagA/CpsF family glycosyltransferase [Dysgonamonadaceae bacterium]|jgi:N-acetylglucosaminyldiphosphoundecaprenol N-acetyl-beta-D-mannosaminyltransferase|nr:WecB/TagA/CpsF family glycosyltransferase [Dysgonamonadaceae bacterium]